MLAEAMQGGGAAGDPAARLVQFGRTGPELGTAPESGQKRAFILVSHAAFLSGTNSAKGRDKFMDVCGRTSLSSVNATDSKPWGRQHRERGDRICMPRKG
jgi:hypothetical protein